MVLFEDSDITMGFKRHPILEVIGYGESWDEVRKLSKSRVGVLDSLLRHNVSPDLEGTNFIEPLPTAVKAKDYTVAKLLLKHGANPNSLDYRDVPVLFIAAAKLDREMVAILLDYKADINIKYKSDYDSRLKNHNVLAYMYRSNNGETRDQIYGRSSDKMLVKETVEMVKYLEKMGVSLKAKVGTKNKTLKGMIKSIRRGDGLDFYGNNWGKMLDDLK